MVLHFHFQSKHLCIRLKKDHASSLFHSWMTLSCPAFGTEIVEISIGSLGIGNEGAAGIWRDIAVSVRFLAARSQIVLANR